MIDDGRAPGESLCTLGVRLASPDNYGAVAQVVERGPEEPCVGGSTPPRPTVPVAEWLRRRIVVPVYVGSIPTGHPKDGK